MRWNIRSDRIFLAVRTDVVTKMEDVVHRVLTRRVAVGIEVTIGIVAAAVHCQIDASDIVIRGGSRLSLTHRRLGTGVCAGCELVVVLSERLEVLRFDFDREINIRGRVRGAVVSDMAELLVRRDLPA